VQLIFVNALRIVEQAPDQCRFSIVDASRGDQPQQVLLLLGVGKDLRGDRLFNRSAQKYPALFFSSMEPSWS
jgi:hypothetical protein